jgi:hypothetical protein
MEKLDKAFHPLTDDEAKEAEAILGDQESVMLPEDHPLRVRVTERVRHTEELRSLHTVSPKAKRRQAKASRRVNR